MKFLRHLLGITKLDKEKNRCIRQKTGAQNIVKEIKQYQKKWLQHVQRMDTNRLPKQELQYKPKGGRNIGWPRKRWKDQLHLEDQGTGNTSNPSGTWWWWQKYYIHYKFKPEDVFVQTILYLHFCICFLGHEMEKKETRKINWNSVFTAQEILLGFFCQHGVMGSHEIDWIMTTQ